MRHIHVGFFCVCANNDFVKKDKKTDRHYKYVFVEKKVHFIFCTPPLNKSFFEMLTKRIILIEIEAIQLRVCDN